MKGPFFLGRLSCSILSGAGEGGTLWFRVTLTRPAALCSAGLEPGIGFWRALEVYQSDGIVTLALIMFFIFFTLISGLVRIT